MCSKPICSTLLMLILLHPAMHAADYFVSPSGNDGNTGTSANDPLKTINAALQRAGAGDRINLQAGAVFHEAVYVGPGSGDAGTEAEPIWITSDANLRAVITPPNVHAMSLYIYNTGGLVLEHLRFVGQGMDTHQADGVGAFADNERYKGLTIRNCEFSGFGKDGFYVGGWHHAQYGFENVLIEDSIFHANRRNGLSTWAQSASGHRDLTVRRCRAYDNLGDPDATQHTGSGIVVGGVTDGLVEHCIAHNNGERCATVGGPVGIWTWNATRVTIQFCESYQNHAVRADGGGFDLDGGCQDCVIQYCYAHDNDGPGFLVAQYQGARAFTNNVIRYNISQNDGRKNDYAGLHFWSSGSSGGVQGTLIYGNTIYNQVSHAVRFQNVSGQSGTRLWNNLFVTNNNRKLLKGSPTPVVANFQGNLYWASQGTFDLAGYSSLSAWRSERGQELHEGRPVGLESNPMLTAPGQGGTLGDTTQLPQLEAYRLQGLSPAIDAGLHLPDLFSVHPGQRDFYGGGVLRGASYDIGAHEYSGPSIQSPPVAHPNPVVLGNP